jgi:NAD(P)-dependent dehydrogenase (short-subunit alcohol dehydrogenase family)
MPSFAGKVALVTGGSAGIGRATALALGCAGAKVVLGDLLEAPGREVVDLIAAAGGEAVFVPADVAEEADCRALVETALSRFGALDCAVNNAGVEQSGRPLTETTREEFDRLMHINVLGVLMGMKHQIPAMVSRGGGAIVNLASIAGLIGFPGAAVYVASKHAVLGLTKTAALEYAESKVRVNAVCPGAIQTEMIERFTGHDAARRAALAAAHPMRRFGRPEEISAGILWLCSEESSFVTGQAIVMDGGYTVQ